VAAGILRRGASILACRRRAGGAFGGRWELPGGKIEPGESPADALVRELREELQVVAAPGPEVERIDHAYPGYPPVRLHFFEVARFEGEPRSTQFDALLWAPGEELLALEWLDADLPLIRRLAASSGRPLPARAGEEHRW